MQNVVAESPGKSAQYVPCEPFDLYSSFDLPMALSNSLKYLPLVLGRLPSSRVRARTSRQGLPVDHDEDDQELHVTPHLAYPAVAVALCPVDDTQDVAAWKGISRGYVAGGGDGDRPEEYHPRKARRSKGERVKYVSPVESDRQPWEKIDRTSKPYNGDQMPSVQDRMDDKADGVQCRDILPFLAQLHAATPNKDPRSENASQAHQREVWTCGQNSYGELGHSDTITRKVHSVVRMLEDREVTDVAAGSFILAQSRVCLSSMSRTIIVSPHSFPQNAFAIRLRQFTRLHTSLARIVLALTVG